MKILLLSGVAATSSRIGTSLWKALASIAALLLLIGLIGTWSGYKLGLEHASLHQAEVVAYQAEVAAQQGIYQQIKEQKREIMEDRSNARDHLDAFASRLGEMQSEILRLNALGERLAKIGNLDTAEFNFGDNPAQGGKLDTTDVDKYIESDFDFDDLIEEMRVLARSIDDRERKLTFLEELLMNQQLQNEIFPDGSPVENGWISSLYGYRKDPFNGDSSFHSGIDIAGKEGSKVAAVASGVVTFSGTRSGYGEVIEVSHGNGYTTLYAHNKKRLVEVGDQVTRGQVIGLMGSTGRSTGPHVHFEVALNGETLDPQKVARDIH